MSYLGPPTTQRRLSIVSVASNGHVIDAYHEVICALRSLGVETSHVGITSDTWYPREGRARYSAYGYATYDLPRPSGRRTAWWHTDGVLEEAAEAMPALGSMVGGICSAHQPAVFLLADDQGPLEVALIDAFKRRGCAVVLMEHGYGHLRLPESADAANGSRRRGRNPVQMARGARRILRRRFSRSARAARHTAPLELPAVGIFGTNGADAVCMYSELSADRLVEAGVDGALLRPTGYPYFDQFVRRAQTAARTERRRRPRAVIVSSGSGTFGLTEDAVAFYELAVDVAAELRSTHDVVFRLKAGEEPRNFLPTRVLERMDGLQLDIDDGMSRSIDILPGFDLAISDVSTVLLEAVILGCMPVLLDPPAQSREGVRRSTLYRILTDRLEVPRISTPQQVGHVCAAAADPSCIIRLRSRLLREQKLLFHALDGRSGLRVAEVVLEVAGRAKG